MCLEVSPMETRIEFEDMLTRIALFPSLNLLYFLVQKNFLYFLCVRFVIFQRNHVSFLLFCELLVRRVNFNCNGNQHGIFFCFFKPCDLFNVYNFMIILYFISALLKEKHITCTCPCPSFVGQWITDTWYDTQKTEHDAHSLPLE